MVMSTASDDALKSSGWTARNSPSRAWPIRTIRLGTGCPDQSRSDCGRSNRFASRVRRCLTRPH